MHAIQLMLALQPHPDAPPVTDSMVRSATARRLPPAPLGDISNVNMERTWWAHSTSVFTRTPDAALPSLHLSRVLGVLAGKDTVWRTWTRDHGVANGLRVHGWADRLTPHEAHIRAAARDMKVSGFLRVVPPPGVDPAGERLVAAPPQQPPPPAAPRARRAYTRPPRTAASEAAKAEKEVAAAPIAVELSNPHPHVPLSAVSQAYVIRQAIQAIASAVQAGLNVLLGKNARSGKHI